MRPGDSVTHDGFQSTRPVKGATLHASPPQRHGGVSIHAPREGRDMPIGLPLWRHRKFQSTRPVKGATSKQGLDRAGGEVSIHAPREGRDSIRSTPTPSPRRFQSTRPVKGATCAKTWTAT